MCERVGDIMMNAIFLSFHKVGDEVTINDSPRHKSGRK